MDDKQREEIIKLMNSAIELEYQAFIQYFYQSLSLKGFSTMAMAQFLAAEADIELGHAKLLAEKVVFMGGVPTSKIAAVKIGKHPNEMIKYNIEREQSAIKIYKELKNLCQNEDDVLYRMIDDILINELKDLDEFTRMVEE